MTINPTSACQSRYTYDMDGNLLKLLRKNAGGGAQVESRLEVAATHRAHQQMDLVPITRQAEMGQDHLEVVAVAVVVKIIKES